MYDTTNGKNYQPQLVSRISAINRTKGFLQNRLGTPTRGTCSTVESPDREDPKNDHDLGVSKNRGGPPKSSILIGFSFINHPFWGTIILGTPISQIFHESIKCFFPKNHFGSQVTGGNRRSKRTLRKNRVKTPLFWRVQSLILRVYIMFVKIDQSNTNFQT